MRFANLLRTIPVLLLLTASASLAQDKPSQADAKALVLKAVDLIGAKSLDGARSVLHQAGEFKHDELYVNVIDTKGVWLVYPPTPSAEGRNVLQIQDATGMHVVQEIIKTADTEGEGWVEYRWMNPVTKQIGPKISYVKRVPGADLIVYVGIYK